MGFKWFRARMSLNKPTSASPTGVAGFYRTTSNFDGGVWPPPPTMILKPSPLRISELKSQKPRPISKPVSPPQVPGPKPQNPMAAINADESSLSLQHDSGSSEELGQFKLPRASVDILREKNSDDGRKTGVKKKKVAPRPHEVMVEKTSSAKELVI